MGIERHELVWGIPFETALFSVWVFIVRCLQRTAWRSREEKRVKSNGQESAGQILLKTFGDWGGDVRLTDGVWPGQSSEEVHRLSRVRHVVAWDQKYGGNGRRKDFVSTGQHPVQESTGVLHFRWVCDRTRANLARHKRVVQIAHENWAWWV